MLFLDEPTTGLDPQDQGTYLGIYRKTPEGRVEVSPFLTTHYMEEAEICQKVAIIDGGKIVAHDTPSALKTIYQR